ncbi:MAG TPA: hypothetical protein VLR26_12340 [Frankiaceae bacterium]|nr:hypothetical protein [Frankiaceae bacterium]
MAEPERSAPDRADAAESLRSRDEESIGWGDERSDPSDDADLARLLADRPPHHDRD